MTRPHGITGSLEPRFRSARLISLAVKPACALALNVRLPTVLSRPLCSSVTLWEEAAPAKLPILPCSRRFKLPVRIPVPQEWYFTDGSPLTSARGSTPPTYATHAAQKHSIRLQLRFTGSFRPAAGNRYLRRYCNFTESLVETVPNSLCLSCRSELTRQGISLP